MSKMSEAFRDKTMVERWVLMGSGSLRPLG